MQFSHLEQQINHQTPSSVCGNYTDLRYVNSITNIHLEFPYSWRLHHMEMSAAKETMERIIEYMRTFAPVSDRGWSYFRDRLELRDYSSGSTIHPAHEPCTELCFILQGVARSYLQSSDGRDFTWFFHYDADNISSQQFILMDYPSFNLLTPSTYGFQALTQCQVATISRRNLNEAYINYSEFLTVEKRLVVSAYQQKNIRIQSLLTQTAKDRLEDFLQIHSRLFNLIPHYHIASYLGITPQRLCQLRRQCA